jgi:hypothetical protein
MKEVYYKFYQRRVKETYYFKFVYHEKDAREVFQWCGEGGWANVNAPYAPHDLGWYLQMVAYKKFKEIKYNDLVLAIL